MKGAEARSRRLTTYFKILGIEPDTELVLKAKPDIKCWTVDEKNQVKDKNGEILSISDLASRELGKWANGFHEFMLNGKILNEISKEIGREYWIKKSEWTLETAEYLLELFAGVFEGGILNYLERYISITSPDNKRYLGLSKRSVNDSLMFFILKKDLHGEMEELLDENNIQYKKSYKEDFLIPIDKNLIEQNKEVFIKLADIIKESKN